MANVLIAKPEFSDGGTITSATSELTNNPATNLQDAQITKTWQASTGVSTVTITVNHGSAVTWQLAAMLGTNFPSTTKLRLRAASTAASVTAGPALTTTITFWPAGASTSWDKVNGFILLASAVNYQHLDLTVSTTASMVASLGFSAGRLYVSPIFQPAKNAEFGMSLGWADDSRPSRTLGGQTYIQTRPTFRFADLVFSFLTEAEAIGTALDFDRLKGTSSDLLFILDADETSYLHQFIVYGRIRETTPVSWSGHGIFEKTYRIEELL